MKSVRSNLYLCFDNFLIPSVGFEEHYPRACSRVTSTLLSVETGVRRAEANQMPNTAPQAGQYAANRT